MRNGSSLPKGRTWKAISKAGEATSRKSRK